MRDFDELFFFAGATESDIAKFADEAKLRGLALQNIGAFWSLSCGADYAKCIRELGGLYDRALRYHAFRVGLGVSPSLAKTPEKQMSSVCTAEGGFLKHDPHAAAERNGELREVTPSRRGSRMTMPPKLRESESGAHGQFTGKLVRKMHFIWHSPDVWGNRFGCHSGASINPQKASP